ncbi:MAG: PAS domain S-box protein [Pseudomonadota bacterium]
MMNLRSSSTWKFFKYSLFCFLAIVAIITTIYCFSTYKRQNEGLNDALRILDKSHVPALIAGLWVTDHDDVQKVMNSITLFRYIERVEVQNDAGRVFVSGADPDPGLETATKELSYTYKDTSIPIGFLKLFINKRRMLLDALEDAALILAVQIFLSLILAAVNAGAFYLAFGRRLFRFARFIGSDEPTVFHQSFSLERRSKRNDELQLLVDHFNALRARISSYVLEIERANERLTATNAQLLDSERQLRGSREQFANAFEYAPIGMALASPDGRVLNVNQALCAMLGYSPSELLALAFQGVALPDDFNGESAQARRMLAGEIAAFTMEKRYLHKSGSLVWALLSVSLSRDQEGAPLNFISQILDITARKQAEEKLRHSQLMLARTERIAHVGSWEWKISSDTVTWSEEMFRIFQLDLSDQAPRWADHQVLFHPGDQELLGQAVAKALADGTPYELELRAVRGDGRIRTCIACGFAEIGFGGCVERLFGSLRDITERKSAEEALRAGEERFRQVYEQMGVGVARVSLDFLIESANEAYCRLLGYGEEELIGKHLREITHPDMLEENLRRQRQLAVGEIEHFRMEKAFIHKSGRIIHGLLDANLVRGVDGLPKYFLGSVVDITDVKRVEKEQKYLQTQLKQAQKMEAIGTLAGGISHDFNNLLQAINGYTQILLLDANPAGPEYPSLTAIQKAGNRAAGLIRQLLLFSRKADSERRPVELNQEVEQARRLLERTIPRMVDLEVRPGGRLWPILADPVQIEQILLNLGTNAADAMPEGGNLVIETENITLGGDYVNSHLGATPGRYVLMTVTDTGHGMDKETVEKIFEPFFTTKEIGKGTGLGLASVYGIVKNHGGHIMCYSEVGQGTTFKIFLPAAAPADLVETDEVFSKPLRGGAETILLADDEESIRDFASQVLKKFGYTVLGAASGEEALEIYSARSAEIDLVIMDLGMPGMGGHKCLQELIKLDAVVKVVIASGYSSDDQVKKALAAGAAGYVGKPYHIDELLNTTREVLANQG